MMSYTVPTTKEIADQNISNFEGKFNQTTPLQEKAVTRVFSSNDARLFTTLDRFNVERTKQNFALTATGENLENIGREYGIIRKSAEAARLTISLPANNGTIIPITIDFVGDSNYQRYIPDESVTASGGYAIIPITAVAPGSAGNLNIGDTLTIGTLIAGAQSVATVTVVDNVGADQEDQEVYRRRVLNRLGVVGGGSNATDYRRWGEVVSGVKAIYPYAGKPFEQRSYPGDRTIYVEADITVDDDGIAPQSLLDEVRSAINTDPVLLVGLPSLGSTDEMLFIESITRIPIYVTITNLVVNSDLLLSLKTDLDTIMDEFLRGLAPYISGIDYEGSRNDIITDVSVSRKIQDIMERYGATADDIGFGLNPATYWPTYTLQKGELCKLGDIIYVAT